MEPRVALMISSTLRLVLDDLAIPLRFNKMGHTQLVHHSIWCPFKENTFELQYPMSPTNFSEVFLGTTLCWNKPSKWMLQVTWLVWINERSLFQQSAVPLYQRLQLWLLVPRMFKLTWPICNTSLYKKGKGCGNHERILITIRSWVRIPPTYYWQNRIGTKRGRLKGFALAKT